MFRRLVLPLLPVCLSGCGWVVGDLPEPYEANAKDAATDTPATDLGDVDHQLDALEDGYLEGETDAEVDAPAEADVPPDGCDPCDCDDDGYLAEGCQGDDCDDDDGQVHPGQEKYFDTASATVGFDYDCSTKTERDPVLNVAVQCAGLSVIACEQVSQGFIGAVPACGVLGDWGTCRTQGLACEPDVYEQRRMRCH